MNQIDHLERDLSAWFDDTAAPSTPDYMTDILRETARMRQLPRWSFIERWIPMSETTLRRLTPPAVPWRTVGLFVLLVLLLAAVAALWVGSRPRLPAPFGPAANGLVTYAQDGDIWTVDPVTGARSPIVTGPDADTDPRWSLDGTKIAFFRGTGGTTVPAFVTVADGSTVVAPDGVVNLDPESINWSHDNHSVAFNALGGTFVADAATGEVRVLPGALSVEGEPYWRPPDGRQLLMLDHSTATGRLVAIAVADGSIEELPLPDEVVQIDRASGWTPDGKRFAFMGSTSDPERPSTYVVDAETGDYVKLPVAYAQVSNDGTRVVGLRGDDQDTWLCVAAIDGGNCAAITAKYAGNWGARHRWSPDDQWIYTRRGEDDAWFVLDPDSVTDGGLPWTADGVDSWQRLAP
jgi:Tol biopolymer transport system component